MVRCGSLHNVLKPVQPMQCCGHAHGSSVLERHWWLPVYWSAPHRLLLLRSCCIGISHTLSLTLHTAIHIGTTLCIPTTDSLPLSRLGCIVLRDNNAAFTAALLFCVTPANIHMSAVYVCRILFFTARSHCVMTKRLVSRMSYLISRICCISYSESLFAALSFGGLYLLECGRVHVATIVLALTSGVRSNGSLYAWFFAYPFILHLLSQPRSKWLQRVCSIDS
jgi:hypothetical protein